MASQGSVEVAPVFLRWVRRSILAPGQTGGRVPNEWRQILAKDPWMRNVAMAIEVVFGGLGETFRIRIATDAVESVSSSDGLRYDCEPLLIEEPEIVQEIAFGEGTSSARSVALTLDGALVNAPRLLARGGILAGFAEISLEPLPSHPDFDPSDYDRRYVLLRGDVTGVRFGAGPAAPGSQERAELVEIEVVDPKETIGAKLPPWVLDANRISTLHPTGVGERYQIIVNGYEAVPAIRATSTSPGTQRFIFAYGQVANWTVSTVYVNGEAKLSGDPTYAWTPDDDIDAFGQTYAYIRFTNGATVWEDSDAVHVSVEAAGKERGVIQALRYVLEQFTPLGLEGSNAELYSTAEARLPIGTGVQVLVNASGGSNAGTGIEWAETGYLAQFPMISMVWENGTYGPVVTDRRLSPLAHWTVGAGPLLDRDTLVSETPKAEICNEFVLRYAYDPLLDVYEKVVIRGASNSAVCEFSERLVGTRHAEPLEAPYIEGDYIANYVIDWMVDHMALPSYVVDYVASPDVLLRYRRGDRIDLTDEEMEWSRVPATIQAIRYRRGRATVTLRVWIGYLNALGAQSQSAVREG
jgi:hypothetical protein